MPDHSPSLDPAALRQAAQAARAANNAARRRFHIHHIVSFQVRELRAEVSNLITLCAACHRFVHSRANVAGEFIGKEGPYGR